MVHLHLRDCDAWDRPWKAQWRACVKRKRRKKKKDYSWSYHIRRQFRWASTYKLARRTVVSKNKSHKANVYCLFYAPYRPTITREYIFPNKMQCSLDSEDCSSRVNMPCFYKILDGISRLPVSFQHKRYSHNISSRTNMHRRAASETETEENMRWHKELRLVDWLSFGFCSSPQESGGD